jgi:hypothetical protein
LEQFEKYYQDFQKEKKGTSLSSEVNISQYFTVKNFQNFITNFDNGTVQRNHACDVGEVHILGMRNNN